MSGAAALTAAIAARRATGSPAISAYLTAGFPAPERFPALVRAIAAAADIVEVGVPFSDPMADGVTIQRASRVALDRGTTLAFILDTLEALAPRAAAPLVLMGYLNPFLAFGVDRLAARARAAGVSGFIVPDLPLEECDLLRAPLEREGLALVQLVTPVTPPARLAALCDASRGFVYAVTVAGITGGGALPDGVGDYLDRVRAASALPVLAGFGIRRREQVAALGAHADGVVVGSALVEEIERGGDPAAFLAGLRP